MPEARGAARGGGGRESEGAAVEWVGAKYSRERLMQIAKRPVSMRRPLDLPPIFCRDEPGNLAEVAKNERSARRKEEKERERERKEGKGGGRGGREERDPGRAEFFGRAAGQGGVAPGRTQGGAGIGGGGAPPRGAGGASAEERHRMMMEEVERERAAFAAERAQKKSDATAAMAASGQPAEHGTQHSVFGGGPGGFDQQHPDVLDKLFATGTRGGGTDEPMTAAMGDMSLQIPLPAVVPPEESPSKFLKSRAGRWSLPPPRTATHACTPARPQPLP